MAGNSFCIQQSHESNLLILKRKLVKEKQYSVEPRQPFLNDDDQLINYIFIPDRSAVCSAPQKLKLKCDWLQGKPF